MLNLMTAFAVFLFVFSLMAKTLFDKYGGVPMATRVARDFHERLMRRPHLRRYFLDLNEKFKGLKKFKAKIIKINFYLKINYFV